MKKFSVIIPYTYGGELRKKNLKVLLDCIQNQTFQDFDLIITEELINTVHSSVSMQMMLHYNVTHHMLKNDKLFNKSWIINVAMKEIETESALVIDADMLFGNDYFQKVADYKEAHNMKFFIAYLYLDLLKGKDEPQVRRTSSFKLEAVGGSWFVDKDYFFDKVGGMNENYFGFGAEDNDIWQRINYLHGTDPIPMMPYNMQHQYHDWAPAADGRLDLLNRTWNHPDTVIEKLKEANLGQKSGPTLIDISDVTIEERRYTI